MNVDVLRARAALSPRRDAVWDDGRWWSFGELDARADRLARRLVALGVRPGDRVAVLAQNRLEHVDALFAAPRAGFVHTPFNTRLSERESREIARYVRPSLLLFDDANRAVGEALAADGVPAVALERYEAWLAEDEAPLPAPNRSPEDAHMMLFTGGTTGLPKGALIPYRQVFFNAVNTVMSWGVGAGDSAIQATPCFHAAVNVLLTPLVHAGGRSVLVRSFDPVAYLRLVEEVRPSVLFLVPTMFALLAECEAFAEADFSSVRWAISGGAPCPEPVREAFRARGVRFRQGYGLTEAGVNCFAIEQEDADARPLSVGRPMLHARAVVRRPDGTPAAAGETGELTVAGPHVFGGYFERPDATAEALRDGWLWTGDLAREDDEGFFYISGRRKEMFISGGENVYPLEVETALYEHPAVGECAVVGVPDDRWGEVGLAVVTPRAGQSLSVDGLRAHLRERLARYKVPKHIETTPGFVPALPKSGAGKILKAELARLWSVRAGAPGEGSEHVAG